MLTKKDVDRLRYDPTGPAQQILYDGADGLSGFGCRVYPSGKKSFVVRYRTNSGRVRFLTLGRYGPFTVQAARELAKSELHKVRTGGDPLEERRQERQAETVKELGEVYMERHAKRQKRSWKEDQRLLASYIYPRLGHVKANDLKRADVAKLFHAVGARSHTEANKVLSLLSVMLNKGVEWGLREETLANPCARIKKYRIKARERWVQPDELPALLAAIEAEESPINRALLLLYLLTGCRKSELLTLKWSDVDLERREITLRDTKQGRTHAVPLVPAAVDILGNMERFLGNPYVFPSPKKPRTHLRETKRPWDRVRARFWLAMNPDVAAELRREAEADVDARSKHAEKGPRAVDDRLLTLALGRIPADDVLRLHDLRRTVGSLLASRGESLHLIGSILGHSNASTTQIYARLTPDARRGALERMAAALPPLDADVAGEVAS